MAPTTVAFDTGPLHGPRTGIGLAVEAMQRALEARDDIRLLPYVLSFRAAVEPGTTRLPLPARLAHRAWAHAAVPRVDRWLDDASLVHGTNYVVPPTRLPRVVSVYDCWFLRHPHQAGGDVRRAGHVLRRAIADGALVHTSSLATELVVRELFPDADVCTVHLGPLDVAAPAAAAPVPELADVPFVVAIGTVERRKNLSTLVRAFGQVARDDTDLRLVLAGAAGDDSAAVRDAIDELPPAAGGRVLRTGRIDEAVRAWLLANATVLAYPSLDEGFGFPLLDAMRAGLPVVASDAGSIPEVAGDAALLAGAHDVDGLASAIDAAVHDSDVRARLVRAGDEQWRRFSWDRCAAGLVELYQRAREGTGRR